MLKLRTLSFVYQFFRQSLQNADFVLTSPLRLSQNYGLVGLLRLNPIRFGQEGEIATQESIAIFALSLTWVVAGVLAHPPVLVLHCATSISALGSS